MTNFHWYIPTRNTDYLFSCSVCLPKKILSIYFQTGFSRNFWLTAKKNKGPEQKFGQNKMSKVQSVWQAHQFVHCSRLTGQCGEVFQAVGRDAIQWLLQFWRGHLWRRVWKQEWKYKLATGTVGVCFAKWVTTCFGVHVPIALQF